jgi:hypothetical protein
MALMYEGGAAFIAISAPGADERVRPPVDPGDGGTLPVACEQGLDELVVAEG